MSDTPTIPPIVNKTMKIILRSLLHGMISKSILLVTFNGRKSGKTYTTPVSYSQQNGQVHIFSHAAWWKNLKKDEKVTLRIRGRDIQGLAEPVTEDKEAIASGLASHLRKVPSDSRYYDVSFDDQGNPRSEEVKKAVQTAVMICVQLF